jgi:hypothetical protein
MATEAAEDRVRVHPPLDPQEDGAAAQAGGADGHILHDQHRSRRSTKEWSVMFNATGLHRRRLPLAADSMDSPLPGRYYPGMTEPRRLTGAPRARRRWIGPVLVTTLIVAVALGTALLRIGGRDAPGPDGESSFPRVEELRVAVDQCNEALAAEQERFQAHERAVDSLRAAVFAYESEERTVPAEEFDAYLEVFAAYNQSVREWHERASALEARWETCHELAEQHNALVDSLSGRPRTETPASSG